METELIKFVAAIFVITNPLGAVPLFLSLTKEYTSKERRRAAWLASITVVIVLSANILFGELILRFFAISIPAFQVGGGIIILLLAISMLQARQSPTREGLGATSTMLGINPRCHAFPSSGTACGVRHRAIGRLWTCSRLRVAGPR